MKPLVVPQAWARTTTFTGLLQNAKVQSPNVNAKLCEMVRKCRSEDIATLPLFYVFMACHLARLSRQGNNILFAHKQTPASVSSPLFIIHILLWCQGQSDSIVMVKGKSGEPELSTRTANPGSRQTKRPTAQKNKRARKKKWVQSTTRQ